MASDVEVNDRITRFRELFANGPEVGRTAAENVLKERASRASGEPASRMESAGRVGSRQGKVSELTVVAPLAAGGAERLRAFLRLVDGDFDKADLVGTVHDMRFVFLENDTKLLFATAYDGEWDAYIDDFAAKIPDYLDVISSAWEGWPGIRSPEVKDFFAEHQITAEGWYVANPDLTVAETRRLKRVGKVVEQLLDEFAG